MDKTKVFFPYESVRSSQDEFIKDVFEVLKNKKHFLAHVPTGVGKTISTLGVCLRHAIDNGLKVIFITPKHTQHKIAIDTLSHIKDKYDIDLPVVDLIGKKWMCLVKGANLLSSSEFGDYCSDVIDKGVCEFYNNFKDKSQILLRESLLHELKTNILYVEDAVERCSDAKMCPFEVITCVGKDAKVIICDYFHILSESVRETLFERLKIKLEDCVIVVDEAQNLPDKCRDLMSTKLSGFVVDGAISEAGKFNFELDFDVLKLRDVMNELSAKIPLDVNEVLVKKEDFFDLVPDYLKVANELEDFASVVREEKKRSYLGSVANFMKVWLGDDEGFVRILERGFSKQGKPIISLSYKCLDPSFIMGPIISEARNVIGMSGTLYPLEMYNDLLGFENVLLKDYKNPFPSSNRLNLIVPETTTKFTMRSVDMYKKIAIKCKEMVEAVKGNCIVFFPSYNIRDAVYVYFKESFKGSIFLEKKNLLKEEKEMLVNEFKECNKEGGVLLGVSGGSFGEGLDLPGDYLKGVFIVGVPLGRPDLEAKELINYYDLKFGNGREYGYIFPAFVKCLQNAGRCIRSEKDRGVVVFLDERFSWSMYFKYFPKDLGVIVTRMAEKKIFEFFGEKN